MKFGRRYPKMPKMTGLAAYRDKFCRDIFMYSYALRFFSRERLQNGKSSLRGIAEVINRQRIPMILASHTVDCRARTLCSLAMTRCFASLNMTMDIFVCAISCHCEAIAEAI